MQNEHPFPLELEAVLERVDQVDCIAYARDRNHLSGSVSYLSPYLTRGLISLPFVAQAVCRRYTPQQAVKFLQELAWREYFQKVWWAKGSAIFDDMKRKQTTAEREGVPQALVEAHTSIAVIDSGTQELVRTGYMHNHLRMWTAALACHHARCHWGAPSRWMYYHLLDGDLASNSLSWQWVAGCFSSKPYVAHQALMNACSDSSQEGSFLDHPRETLLDMPLPSCLETLSTWEPQCSLEATDLPQLEDQEPVLLYHPWNLDPEWHRGLEANRVLVLEPEHFSAFPVSPKVLSFIQELGRENLPQLQIYIGSIDTLWRALGDRTVHYRKHPALRHWPGVGEPSPELFPEVQGYYPSFFKFWKQCQKRIHQIKN